MARTKLAVADAFRRHGEAYRHHHGASLSTAQRRMMTAVERCRTAALGGHVDRCDQCGHLRISYDSWRNRHCPTCQSMARARWLEERQAEVLDVPYFHVVFTLPQAIAGIALQNKKTVYDLLFRAAAEILRSIAADPKHLGAEIGFFAVLHTWGQNLLHHPHLHCVVPGGGLAHDGGRWIACRPGFFLPVRVLARRFRHLFLDALRKPFEANRLQFFGDQAPLQNRPAFLCHLAATRKTDWVVHAKPPFASSTEAVLRYVARYTHRVAIGNDRLLDIDGGVVRFRWKDYRRHGRQGTMTLAAEEFIRRFLLHVLPPGFRRIRYFGFLGNRHRAAKLARCRELLGMAEPSAPAENDHRDLQQELTGTSLRQCPICRHGHMMPIERLLPDATGPPAGLPGVMK
jgi:hypothetical protein